MDASIIKTRNLFHLFKRQNVSAYDINEYIRKYPDTERRVGALPVDWLKNLPKDMFAHTTETADILMHHFSKTFEKSPGNEHFFEIFIKNLKQILNRKDIDGKLEGVGAFKYCHKLIVGEYSYALSTFKPRDKDNYFALRPNHGQCAEPQKAFWAYKNSSHGRVAKPFMARFCAREDDGGYILSKFIDKKDKKRAKTPLNPFRDKFYPLINEDNYFGRNEINGICIDVGGIRENERAKINIPDKEFERNLFVFLDRVWANKGIYNPFTEDYVMKLIKNGIDIYNTDLRTLDLKNERDIIKLVRRMRAVHNLKTELVAKGDFEKYKELLRDYSGHFTPMLHHELH